MVDHNPLAMDRPDLGPLGVKLRWSAQLAPSANVVGVKP